MQCVLAGLSIFVLGLTNLAGSLFTCSPLSYYNLNKLVDSITNLFFSCFNINCPDPCCLSTIKLQHVSSCLLWLLFHVVLCLLVFFFRGLVESRAPSLLLFSQKVFMEHSPSLVCLLARPCLSSLVCILPPNGPMDGPSAGLM